LLLLAWMANSRSYSRMRSWSGHQARPGIGPQALVQRHHVAGGRRELRPRKLVADGLAGRVDAHAQVVRRVAVDLLEQRKRVALEYRRQRGLALASASSRPIVRLFGVPFWRPPRRSPGFDPLGIAIFASSLLFAASAARCKHPVANSIMNVSTSFWNGLLIRLAEKQP
jgi:hypothetical protein